MQGPVYQAMYDYDAQDDDEVGFQENDVVVNVEPIDEGWMFGTIERTGMRGMLPANYVERIQWRPLSSVDWLNCGKLTTCTPGNVETKSP